ncbi:MAG: T9SS type A sorting domain-containing protein [Aequorivita sp.]
MHGDTDSATDWTGGCEPSDFGVPNSDIDIATAGCPGERTKTDVILEGIDPIITCPSDLEVTVNGLKYTVPDLSGEVTVTDNCTAKPLITQTPEVGTLIGPGDTTVTVIATDEANNSASCTFVITVEESGETGGSEFYNNIQIYPNPTSGNLVLKNKTTAKLQNAIIIDSRGRIIKTIDLSKEEIETHISLENETSGLYFIQINTNSLNIVKTIIKQ